MNIGSLPPTAAVAVQTAQQAGMQASAAALSLNQLPPTGNANRTLIDASAIPIAVLSGRGRIVDTTA